MLVKINSTLDFHNADVDVFKNLPSNKCAANGGSADKKLITWEHILVKSCSDNRVAFGFQLWSQLWSKVYPDTETRQQF